jgi:hypothetical protein
MIEAFSGIFSEKSQHEISVLLKQCIPPPVTSVSFCVSQVLSSVEFDYEPVQVRRAGISVSRNSVRRA